jgi:drug/metabolite transporter (DMT)-like permease
MEEKRNLDGSGVVLLVLAAVVMGTNQAIIKLVNDGLQPVFAAGLRSAGGTVLVLGWMLVRGQRPDFRPGTIRAGLLIGTLFALEFLFLFLALDKTTVIRTSVIFYSMPVWLAGAAHFLLPGERLTGVKSLGLGLAFAGVVWAIVDRGGVAGEASLIGDLFALAAALGWMGLVLVARMSSLRAVSSNMQIFWQVLVSTPLLLGASLFFGPWLRAFEPVHLFWIGYQMVVVVAIGFLVWFWLLNRYKAAPVASFSFLSPVIGVAAGWLFLDEPLTASLVAKLALVAVGIVLINRPARRV